MPAPLYKSFYTKDRKTWRKWLEKNHISSPGIWFIYNKKTSSKKRLPYADAVEEALYFGYQ